MIKIYTIGFTEKSAENFFGLLKTSDVKKIVDTRIHNSSQLAGFAKAADLQYFAREIADIGYEYKIDFAPTKDMLSRYRNGKLSWAEYEIEYLNLLDTRKIAQKTNVETLHESCLLCSEHSPEQCHRRLLAEYLQQTNNSVQIIHLIK